MFPIRGGKELIPVGLIVDRTAEQLPDHLALKKDDISFTYQELMIFSGSLAGGLLSRGLRPGDRVGIIGENSPHWCAVYLSILKAGMTVVPIDPMLPIADVRHVITDSRAKVVFTDQKWFEDLRDLKISRIVQFDDAHNLQKTGIKLPEVDLDTLAALIYTSGTTGFSKGVMLSHRNIVADVNSMYKSIDYDKNDRFLALLPLHHTFKATCGFLAAVYEGAQIYFPGSLKSRDIIAALSDYEITIMLVVPLILEKFLQALERKVKKSGIHRRMIFSLCLGFSKILPGCRGFLFKGVRNKLGMSRIRYIISGGAALPVSISKKMRQLGIQIIQGYGLTEASPVLTVNPPDRPRDKSVGIPIPGVRIKIKNQDENGVGEVIASGDNIMLGYYNNEEATREVLQDGWLYTGDLGRLDDDGYLYIVGRKKYVIVTAGGKNVFPEEIEAKLSKSEYISEILVMPGQVEDKEVVTAIVFPDFEKLDRDFKNLNPEKVEKIIKKEIIKHGAHLPNYKKVTRFTIRNEEFPKTTTRKIKRHLFVSKKVEV